MDIEITADGIAEENVMPTFKLKYTFAEVNMTVKIAPSKIPLKVNSGNLSSCEKKQKVLFSIIAIPPFQFAEINLCPSDFGLNDYLNDRRNYYSGDWLRWND